MKFERLWHKNEHELMGNRSICFRCCDTIGQIERIQTNIKQLSEEKEILMNKIEHQLSKRALILQGQRQRTNHFLINHQVRFSGDFFEMDMHHLRSDHRRHWSELNDGNVM